MWCANCQADVAAEVTADNRQIRCASCSTEIASRRAPAVTASIREARELLERWSRQRLADPYGPIATRPADLPSVPEPAALAEPTMEPPTPPIETAAPPARRNPSPQTASVPQWPETIATMNRRIDPVETETRGNESPSLSKRTPAAEFDGEAVGLGVERATTDRAGLPFGARAERPNSPWPALVGPLLTYVGVLGLTVGTIVALLGYFGGERFAGLTPTGWLVAAVGQMLLFLGVATIITTGMEQMTGEVTRRLDRLGDRLLRIEHAARNPVPPPHLHGARSATAETELDEAASGG